MLNHITIHGRLTADPELKQTSSGVSVLSFTVAVNRSYVSKNSDQGERQADFITVVAWRQTAEFVSKCFRKGSAICVTGSIQTRSWTDNQGQKRIATEVVVDEATFVGGPNTGNSAPVSGGSYTPEAYAAPSFNSASSASFEEIPSDDSLPF